MQGNKKIYFNGILLLTVIYVLFLTTPSVSQSPKSKSQRPTNIILMIGDGMGLSQITAGLYANGNKLNLEKFHYCGFSKTHSGDTLITDSGAGATAISTGHKTYNGAIGVDMNKKPLKTILEIAEENQLATGLVVTDEVTGATPASFVAHVASRKKYEEIALGFLKTSIDVFIGGGRKEFINRQDSLNLLDSLKTKKFIVATSLEETSKISSGKLAALVAEKEMPSIKEGRSPDFLQNASQTAIHILKNNSSYGFFLMIEGSQIDWGGHDNDLQYVIDEMLDFDKTIGKVLEFAEKDGNTLVIVTADHETGGLAVTEGNIANKAVAGKFISKGHTGNMVPVFAFGPYAENFSGIYDNTEIFNKMIRALGFSK